MSDATGVKHSLQRDGPSLAPPPWTSDCTWVFDSGYFWNHSAAQIRRGWTKMDRVTAAPHRKM